jgi:hypothetical protein
VSTKTKLRVFLSSALDADLKADRGQVRDAIANRSDVVEFVGVEGWPADDVSPRRNSLDSLATCHVYVGIFATRCGALTLEEYQFARREKIPQLLFFKKPGADAAKMAADDPAGAARIQEIRDDYERHGYDLSTTKDYSEPWELHAIAGNAIDHQWRKRIGAALFDSRGDPPPKYLATLCDRNEQQPRIDELLEAMRTNRKRSLLILALPGADNEDHEAFVSWYHLLRLRKEYGLGTDAQRAATDTEDDLNTNVILLDWRENNASVDARFASLRRELAEALLPRGEPPPIDHDGFRAAIAGALNAGQRHFTLRYNLRSGSVRPDDCELLRRWLEFLLSLPLATGRYMITVFFCLRMQPGLMSFAFGSRRLNSIVGLIKDWQEAGLACLPRLTSPSRSDAEIWADTRCIRYFPMLDSDVLMRRATQPFAERAAIPFYEFKPTLESALLEAYRAYRAGGSGTKQDRE